MIVSSSSRVYLWEFIFPSEVSHPGTCLCQGVEFMGQPKAEAFYNLAKSLVEKGVPIHGVGLQCHITVGELKADKLVANIRRFEEIGLKCIITELDIAQDNPGSEGADVRQAIEYCETVNAALSEPNCPTVMIWGIKDDDSWRKAIWQGCRTLRPWAGP